MAKNCKSYKARKYSFRSDRKIWCTACNGFVPKPHDEIHIDQMRVELIVEHTERQNRAIESFLLELEKEYGVEFAQQYPVNNS